jgi:hypothetical protein
MTHNVRVVELPSKEAYVDLNDLIIELLLKAENAVNESEKKVYKELADKLSSIRDRAHKVGVPHEQKF